MEKRILKIGERERMVPHEQKATRRGKQIWWKFREPVSRVKGVLGSGVQCWMGEWAQNIKQRSLEFLLWAIKTHHRYFSKRVVEEWNKKL